jgi:hypothetical protein
MNNTSTRRYGTICSAVASLIATTACGGGGGTTAFAEPLDAQRSMGQSVRVMELGAAGDLVQSAEPASAVVPGLASVAKTAGALAATTDLAIDLSPAPAPASAAKPKIAALYWGSHGTTAQQREIARFDFVLTGLYGSQSYMQSFVNTMRGVNPKIKLAHYAVVIESPLSSSDPIGGAIYNAKAPYLNANDWWLRDANGQLVAWTSAFGTYYANVTAWAPKDASGRRWPQVAAQVETDLNLSKVTGLEYVFVDNVFGKPRNSADWKRNGTNQLATDPEIQAAFRQGQVDYFTALRNLNPGIKIMGNADNDLSSAEFKGKLEGAMLECAFGKSWSHETAGWNRMMSEYRKMLANTTGPKDVVLQGCAPNGVDLSLLRYGMASTLLEDGWYSYRGPVDNIVFRADEYDAPLGTAAEAPPTAATASGIWLRRYTNGMVLVNPVGNTTASVNIGPGYKRLLGTQDPATNNGQPITTVTLLPRQGLILLKQ